MCWKMFLILCCFLLPSVCGDCVCTGSSSGTGGLECALADVSNTVLFSAWPGLCVVFLILFVFWPTVCGSGRF